MARKVATDRRSRQNAVTPASGASRDPFFPVGNGETIVREIQRRGC